MHDLLRSYAAHLAARHDTDQAQRTAMAGLFDYYLTACAAAMARLAPAAHHQQPHPPPAGIPVPEFGDRAATRAWLDTELSTLTALVTYTAGYGWPGHTTRPAGWYGLPAVVVAGTFTRTVSRAPLSPGQVPAQGSNSRPGSRRASCTVQGNRGTSGVPPLYRP